MYQILFSFALLAFSASAPLSNWNGGSSASFPTMQRTLTTPFNNDEVVDTLGAGYSFFKKQQIEARPMSEQKVASYNYQGSVPSSDDSGNQYSGYAQSSALDQRSLLRAGQQQTIAAPVSSGYGQQFPPQTPPTSGYGQQFPPQTPPTSGYGQQLPPQTPPSSGYGQEQPPQVPVMSGYGQEQPPQSPPSSGYGQQVPPQSPPTSGYGQQIPPQSPPTSGYGMQIPPQSPPTSGYGQQIPPQTPPTSGYGYGQQVPPQTPPTSGYGQQDVFQQRQFVMRPQQQSFGQQRSFPSMAMTRSIAQPLTVMSGGSSWSGL